MEKKGLFKGKIIFVLVALVFALIGTSFFVGNRQIKIVNEITVAEDLTGPTESTEGYWTDAGRRGDSFAGGDGLTEETAYEIATAEQLAYLACSVNNGNSYYGKYFKQTADIDLSKYYWEPIGKIIYQEGSSSSEKTVYKFCGNYDGYDYTISGIFTKEVPISAFNNQNINLNTYSNQALFGLIGYSSQTIKNIKVVNSSIKGYDYVAGIVAESRNYGGEVIINNCHFSGNVKGYDYVAGIIGHDYSTANVLNCGNTGNISGSKVTVNVGQLDEREYVSNYVGGVAGSGCIIKNCYNTGFVSSYYEVGGIIGSGSVYNCYNAGKIRGEENVGGIAGESSEIINCYNSGYIYEGVNVGGILGATGYTSNLIINCFNIGTFESNSQSGALVGIANSYGDNVQIFNCYYNNNYGQLNSVYKNECAKTVNNSIHLETLMSKSSDILWYTDENNWFVPNLWDFNYIWQINEEVNENIPIKFQGESNIIYWTDEEVVGNHQGFEEEGTEDDPYLIETEYDLAYLSYSVLNSEQSYNFVNKYFKQTKDLDMSQYAWTPIGQAKEDLWENDKWQGFSGNYNGDFHTISGLNTYVEIIDYNEKNFDFSFEFLGNGHSKNFQGLFGLVCSEYNSNYWAEIKNLGIINSNIKGNVYVGGIAGYCYNNTIISNCYNKASVSGLGYVGGITGGTTSSTSGIIMNCFNSGKISFSGYGPYTIYDNKGIERYFGGICGAGSVSTSYNIGEVNISCVDYEDVYDLGRFYVGGIVGTGYSSNTFNVGTITSNYVGGISGDWRNFSCYNNYSLGIINGKIGADALFYSRNNNFNDNGTNFYASSVGEGVVSNYGQLNSELTFDTFKSEEFFQVESNWYYNFEAIIREFTVFWDFDSIWEFKTGENDGYPIIKEYRPTYWKDYRASSFNGGNGSKENPFKISSAEELSLLAYEVNNGDISGKEPGTMGYPFFEGVYFEQTCDIDLSAHLWNSIGYMNASNGEGRSFAGNYNGNNYIIKGLHSQYQDYTGGVFGVACNDNGQSTISNVILVDSMSKALISGGIVSYAMNFNIINCKNYADVTAVYMAAGGILGGGMNMNIENCLNFGKVKCNVPNGIAGGVAGLIQSGSIKNSGNEANIQSNTMAASICASASCVISNCYSISNDEMILANGGTISNCLYINSNGKFYVGATDTEGNNITSFTEFAWINENSCPIPKSLTWLGQYFTQDITELITSPDSGWINVAA